MPTIGAAMNPMMERYGLSRPDVRSTTSRIRNARKPASMRAPPRAAIQCR